MMPDARSPAIRLLDLVWDSACGDTGHSWERYNHALSGALRLAVGGGFRFDLGDYAEILKGYRTGFWIGESDEWVYSLAVAVGNMSAVKSFEAARSRAPIIADEVEPSGRTDGFTHSVGRRRRARLAVGSRFRWKGQMLTVTSFAPDSSYLTACSYKWVGEDVQCGTCRHSLKRPEHKLDKRYKITRADILADRAERRAEEKRRRAEELAAEEAAGV